jgi:hypothetical protein
MTHVLAPRRSARSTRAFDLSAAGRVLLAVLAASAGVIHLAMEPSHMDSSTVEGIGFALVGWIQITTAVLLVVRPSRALLRFTMVSNVAFVGVWAVSRTYGLPFGRDAGHPHDVAFVDLAAVGIELALVVAAAVFLEHPRLARSWSGARLAVFALVPLSIVALATAALASPSARSHTHSQDDGVVAAGGGVATAGAVGATPHVHVHTGTAAATTVDDKGLSLLQNEHQHAFGEVKLDAATQAALTQQLNQTSKLIARYPTVAAAEAAGYRRAGPFTPGLGTHYGGLGNRNMGDDVIQGIDGPMYPMLIFDGTDPDSPLAGFMFVSLASGGPPAPEPQGFIGENDHWHYHTNVCTVFHDGVIDSPFGADRSVTPQQCRSVGGRLMASTPYMVHVWTVPGYESPNGVFSEINPKLTCPDGTYYQVNPNKVNLRLSTCKSATA